MAVTFNPSITNYKPSFAGKQKAPTSSAHVSLATAADTVSIAAKPVVKNTLGHRLRNLAFGAMTLASTAFMGASCEKPIDPPIVVKPPVNDITKWTATETFNNWCDSLGIGGYDKNNEKIKKIKYHDGWTNEIKEIEIDYAKSTDKTLFLNVKNWMSGVASPDTGYAKIVATKNPKILNTLEYVSDPTFTQQIGVGSEGSYYLNSANEGLIKSHAQTPYMKITKAGTDILDATSLISVPQNTVRQIEILDVQYVAKSPKRLKNVVKTVLNDTTIVAKKAAKTIRY